MAAPHASAPTYYSIHDIVTVRTNAEVPIPDRFRVRPADVEDPDIRVTCGPVDTEIPRKEMTRCNIFFFGRTDSTFVVDYMLPIIDASLVLTDLEGDTELRFTSSFRRFGDVTNLFNTVLLFKLIQKGYTFAHTGCLHQEGQATLVAGMRDTGKTSTVLSLVDGDETKFMSDDLTILGEDGTAYNYPTEVGISPFTLTGETISYTGGEVRRWLASHQSLSLLVQDVIGYELSERKQVPESAIADTGEVDSVFILGGSGDSGSKSIDTETAVNKLLMTTTELIDPFRIYSLNFYSFYTGYSTADLFEREREILRNAIENADCYELRARDVKEYSSHITDLE